MEESTSIEIQQEADASKINENENTEYTQCRIYRVPIHHRKQNEEAYTPQVISIGPIHHNKEKFKTMEKHKERYFKSFMQRDVVVDEINLVNFVEEMEDRIRRCYVGTIETVSLDQSDGFVKMIILDAIFILELFFRDNEGCSEIDDPMRVEAWLIERVWHDLLLLENQLPFFVIDEIYHLTLPSYWNSNPLIQLTFEFFEFLNILKKSPDMEIQHFTDLLRFFQLPPAYKIPERVPKVTFPKYSVRELHEAGVKLGVISSKCVWDEEASSILDLSFKNGVLEIPLLEFQENTKALVRNIMALEQCDFRRPKFITDFYLILDRLINTTNDVDFLSDKLIVVNSLGDNKAVTSMIHKLNKGILWGDMNSNFNRLCKELNEYYERPCHKWTVILRRQYLTMAILLLVLTIIQTVLSLLQVVL